ncbi:hypothetical protein HDZ31DRAFT_62626 [Schizophyllum fasciatum]
MRFLALTAALSAATAAFAQEALRFGVVSVDGESTVSAGDTLSLVYNSTLARYKPQTVDFLMQGTRKNGDPTPWVLLARNEYGADQKILRKDVEIPDAVGAFGDDVVGWGVWAFITYPYDNYDPPLILTGGVSAPVQVV